MALVDELGSIGFIRGSPPSILRGMGSAMHNESNRAQVGVVTVSDRASQGVYEDKGGPALNAALTEMLKTPFDVVARVIPDERDLIEATLKELVDTAHCCLVVTTGGTGPARRDVTVEATLAVCDKAMPGFGELMRKVSLEKVPTAILSRQEAGIRYRRDHQQRVVDEGGALLVNLPGSPKSIRECLIAVMPAIPYCIDLLSGPFLETHDDVVKAFRPAHAKK
jgi:molybdopterin adenylyltransferase